MTHKKYYDSAYIRDWNARIEDKVQRENGLYLKLDATAFYPEGGGQPGDTGTIGTARVLDTFSENGEVLHLVDGSPGAAGSEVPCSLDWERRFDHMQQHTGQHLLSATCLDLLNAPTLSFHLGEEYATIDVDRTEWTEDELDAVEREVNARIMRSLPIRSYFVSAEEAAELPLVKAPSVEGKVRIVEIEGIEYNACGGTHVDATGELGLLKLLRADKQKGRLRLTFKTGFRALNEFAAQNKVLASLSAKLSVPKEELAERLDKWSEDDRAKQAELNALRQRLDEYAARELLEEAERSDGAVSGLFEDRTMKELQSLAASLTARTRLPVLLGSLPEAKLLLAHGGEAGFSCGALFKETLPAFGGRGGGGDKSAQAGFGSESELTACYEALIGKLGAGRV
ncbi:alanine--tRNA ligase-related protein [Saccharibacillus alkalitolerans]|uniref:Hydrolase n=1 Tax=Saccharibacillus alkalitolerans TaxID=2705290 RepID=A0ABX0EZ68_9BACL|nr:alanine--tRNA ligase-related protein [Saccharibacillus alkalitolerans]NGZ74033.1 hydrolase [Saccharibacillus alkalitolerans]